MKAILGESNLHFYSLSALASSLNATESLALLQRQQLLLLLLGKLGQFKVSFQVGSGFRCLSQILNFSQVLFFPRETRLWAQKLECMRNFYLAQCNSC